jgi:predicted acyl esterase
VVLVGAVALLGGACTTDDHDAAVAAATTTRPEGPILPATVPGLGAEVRGSVEQAVVTGAEPGTALTLYDRRGRPVATGEADEQGSLLFRQVPAGRGYRVGTADASAGSPTFEVVSVEESTPPQSFYDRQVLTEGYQYITTRDGTRLAASVYLPGPVEDGPYPTVVEYSGYDPARPATNLLEENRAQLEPILGEDLDGLCSLVPFACEAPSQPASLLASALGYAVVAVNMRGTGCSGGAYDFFEPLQVLDGYDVIETVAAQPWVRGGKVGMVGLSYPAVAQLFVASARPPSLAAITPLSVYDDTARGVLAPGGIFNKGFALEWAREVGEKAQPYGQGWERDRVDGGDTVCEENQRLRGQNVDAAEKARRYPFYDPAVADPLNPSLFVENIEVPVFLTGTYQDEQTGGRFPLLFDDFDRSPLKRFTASNGTHADGFAPFNLTEWKTFLDLYVAEELTPIPQAVGLFVPLIMQQIFGAELTLPEPRFLDAPSLAAARAAYEAEAPVRLLFESGAGDPDQPGAPVPTAEVRTTSFPPPGTRAVPWYLQPDGSLAPDPPDADGGASRFLVDPDLGDLTTFDPESGGNIFHADARYDWRQEPDGSAVVFLTPPLERDVVLAGTASADLYLRTRAEDLDVGVTLSEVRPDGKETYLQSGFLRTLLRRVGPGSTELLPLHRGMEVDAEPMPKGRFALTRVEILPFAHIVRAGSRLRLSVHTAGGDKPRWSWILQPTPAGTPVDVGHSAAHPSRLVLPVTTGLLDDYPSALPPCPGLRGQPCRDHQPYENARAPERRTS